LTVYDEYVKTKGAEAEDGDSKDDKNEEKA
jgi:hypothetical protein